MHFCACPIHCRVHYRVDMRLWFCRLTSEHHLRGWTIGEFGISSALYVLCCLYWHSFYQIDHSMLWWTVVGVNWLTLCQERRREVFWARYCTSSIPRNKLTDYADDSTLIAIVPSPRVRVTVAESLNLEIGKVSEWCDLWMMKFNARI